MREEAGEWESQGMAAKAPGVMSTGGLWRTDGPHRSRVTKDPDVRTATANVPAVTVPWRVLTMWEEVPVSPPTRCEFPVAAVTNSHKLSGLKQHTLSFCSSADGKSEMGHTGQESRYQQGWFPLWRV